MERVATWVGEDAATVLGVHLIVDTTAATFLGVIAVVDVGNRRTGGIVGAGGEVLKMQILHECSMDMIWTSMYESRHQIISKETISNSSINLGIYDIFSILIFFRLMLVLCLFVSV